MEYIVGRKDEIALLEALSKSKKSEFVAIYGRRRVGKTYLVKTVFENRCCFQMTGIANSNLKSNLTYFHNALVQFFPELQAAMVPKHWPEAFAVLQRMLEKHPAERKIIFLDELPWLDTPQSGFISALEHFWNSWANYRRDIMLIVCGSAASWIINKLISNRGGLHNRLTESILLQPFTLNETEAFMKEKGGVYDRYQLIQLYMVMGGIPYYLDNIQVNRSIDQNIDRMFFSKAGFLGLEYANLFRSIFNNYEKHTAIVEALAQKAKGLNRKELIAMSKLGDSGVITKVLEELEASGFIRRYLPFGRNKRGALFQLIDPFALFYLSFVKDTKSEGEGSWLSQMDSPRWRAWSGYAFEYLCRYHLRNIKKHLGISAVYTEISAWRSEKSENGVQIDLVIDRKDRVIHLCEMKFSETPFVITKAYSEQLKNKIAVFKAETGTTKTIFITMITTFGLQNNEYSKQIVQESLDMLALFE
jgi:uncharacterized protein